MTAWIRQTSMIHESDSEEEDTENNLKFLQTLDEEYEKTEEKVNVEEEKKEENKDGTKAEKQKWDNPIEFLLSCLSLSVGLGNVWRFPFVAYKNGGGAFLVPYFISLFLIGRPMYLLELAIGQFSGHDMIMIWDLAPAFRGIGYGHAYLSLLVASFYCVVIAIALFYLFASMQSVLPWTLCPVIEGDEMNMTGKPICIPSEMTNFTQANTTSKIIASSELYFRDVVLKANPDISNGIGLPDPALLGCLFLVWLLIYLTLVKGVSSSGKVAYFTALFPYVVMFTLLIRGLMLPGAITGIKYLFTPDWKRLKDIEVWKAAVTQSFFSLGVGFGSIVTFASYNGFHHNIYKDSNIIALVDTFTSTLAGLITFSILGYLSHVLGVKIDDVVKDGPGLAFVSYPEIVAKFDFAPQLFAVLFFMMLTTLGLGSTVGPTMAISTIITELYPSLPKWCPPIFVCVVGFLSGIVYTTPGGMSLVGLADYYGASMLVLFIAAMEVSVLTWVYGTDKLIRDFRFMLKRDLSFYWTFCWTVFIPLTLFGMFLHKIITYTPVTNGGVDLPLGAQLFGWFLFLIGVFILVALFIKRSITLESGSGLLDSLDSWGPPEKMGHRREWLKIVKADHKEGIGIVRFFVWISRQVRQISKR